MIDPYLRPQDSITQLLRQTPARASSRRNPIVIGPQYRLFLNDGRALPSQEFAAAGNTSSYLDAAGVALNTSRLKPHAASAEIHGVNLEALVAEFAADLWSVDASRPNWRAARIATDTVAGGTLNAALDGRPVRVGDIMSFAWDDGDAGSGVSRRQVVGLLGKITPASLPATASALGPYNPVTTATDLGTLVAGSSSAGWTVTGATLTPGKGMFQGYGTTVIVGGARKLGDTITITCTTAGVSGTAVFTVTALGSGMTATGVLSVDPDAGEFEIDLSDVGYPDSSVELTKASAAVVGEVITVLATPAYTANAVGTVTVAGSYTGAHDRRYAVEIIAVSGGGTEADIKVYDLAGDDAPRTYVDAIAAGDVATGTTGFTVNLAGTAYAKGELFFVDAVAAVTSGTQFDGVLLDAPIVPAEVMSAYPATTLEEVKIFQRFTGALGISNLESGADSPLTTGADEWSYAAALGLGQTDTGRSTVTFSPFADGYGSVLLSYKACVLPVANESTIELDSELEIIDQLGETGLENWLGRGALKAFHGNQNQVVFAVRTAGDTVEDFTAALRKIQTTDQVYALVPMTDNQDVMELVRSHCDTMSGPRKKNFRRCYIGTDSPGAYLHWGALPGGAYRRGDLASSVFTLGEAYRDDWQFVAADAGATIAVQSLGISFTILEVLNDHEVLTDADVELSATNSGLTVTRPDTPRNVADFVIARSKALASRRCTNVWCDSPIIVANGQTTVVPVKFIAAEIAGLRCALLPQQGLTMTEILSIDSAPSMYTSFDPELLDEVARNGTLVVAQESEGGDVFIRHQLTTRTTDGALAYEDNVGVIVDEFAFAVKDEFRSYIGRRNATPDTISEIDDKLVALATRFTQVSLLDQIIGPAVLTFFDERGNEGQVTVRQDGDLADTLLTYVKLRVPLPINGLNHYIDVEVSEILASPDN